MRKEERYAGTPWFDKKEIITIVGCGGLGSPLTLQLSGLGHEIHLYDHDVIEIRNLGTQLLPDFMLGSKKVEAMKKVCDFFYENHELNIYPYKFGNTSPTTPIMIAALDTMAGRKTMFEGWLEDPSRKLFIDCRLEAEQYKLYIIPNDEKKIERYKEVLLPDSAVPSAPCTYRQTRYVATEAACKIVGMINNFLCEGRVLPFEYIMSNPILFTQIIE